MAARLEHLEKCIAGLPGKQVLTPGFKGASLLQV
jgi:hypothetical protein